LIDIGLLESIRGLAEYRMILFGGLVALLLIVRPRGLLDERLVHRIGQGWRFFWKHRSASSQPSGGG
jgi:branched-chain amino acid transport system permease protein